MNLYQSFCESKTIFSVGIAGIVISFLLLAVLLAVVIGYLLFDVRRRKSNKIKEVQEAERMKKLSSEGLDRVLIYLVFMGQKGHYKMPKNKFPVDKRKDILTEPVWDNNRRQVLLEIAKFYDNAATEKVLDDTNSPYYPLARRVPKGGSTGKEETLSVRGNMCAAASKRRSQASVGPSPAGAKRC